MKLIGSITEENFRNELSSSYVGLGEPGNHLFSILAGRLGSVDTAFILNWTPEQVEGIYTILVNGEEVVWLEVSKSNREAVDFQVASVREYETSLHSKQSRIKLAVALGLARKHRNWRTLSRSLRPFQR